jgi:hypothetical protein
MVVGSEEDVFDAVLAGNDSEISSHKRVLLAETGINTNAGL